jgi:hypothetical protein
VCIRGGWHGWLQKDCPGNAWLEEDSVVCNQSVVFQALASLQSQHRSHNFVQLYHVGVGSKCSKQTALKATNGWVALIFTTNTY